MKAKNLKAQTVKVIIENSSSFICGNVKYTENENRISIFSPKHEQFYSTDLAVNLSGFRNYFTYDHELNKVVFSVIID